MAASLFWSRESDSSSLLMLTPISPGERSWSCPSGTRWEASVSIFTVKSRGVRERRTSRIAVEGLVDPISFRIEEEGFVQMSGSGAS